MNTPPFTPGPELVARFSDVLSRTQTALFHFARGLVGDPELARDVTQDVFLDAWRAAAAGKPPFDAASDESNIRRWLFTVTWRRAAKALRHNRLIIWESLDADQPPATQTFAAIPHFEDQVGEAEALRQALHTLAPQDAASFLLQAVYGFSAAEIAAMLDVTPEVARKRLSRARQRLRNAYTQQAQQPPGTTNTVATTTHEEHRS
mgnify:CR=1 FL=1